MTEAELEARLKDAFRQQEGRMLMPMISFDTFGTVVDLSFEEVNNLFIKLISEYPERLGYTKEEAERLIALYTAKKRP